MKEDHFDVVVIGAGIAGCATAYYLARSGVKTALLDKGQVAGEASQAAAGMLAPLDVDHPDMQSSQQIYLAGLQMYQGLDHELKEETGIDIGLMKIPTMRLALSSDDVISLQRLLMHQEIMPGLAWLNHDQARKREPLLPDTILGALLAPEWNVQPTWVVTAYAQGAKRYGTRVFEARSAEQLLFEGERLAGVQTSQGPLYAGTIVLAAGAWSDSWHVPTAETVLFPVKGQIMALHAPLGIAPVHTLYHHQIGCVVPKADGCIYVGSTKEDAHFDKNVTVDGINTLISVIEQLAPDLKNIPFERAWAGLRPGTADGLPLLGESQNLPGLWVATGLYSDGILLGPIIGRIIAECIQGHAVPFGLDLEAFHPDRFGGWKGPGTFNREVPLAL